MYVCNKFLCVCVCVCYYYIYSDTKGRILLFCVLFIKDKGNINCVSRIFWGIIFPHINTHYNNKYICIIYIHGMSIDSSPFPPIYSPSPVKFPY